MILHVADHPETKAQSQRLAKALREVGVSAKAVPAAGKNHGTINSDLGTTGDEPTKRLFEFLDEALKRTKQTEWGRVQDRCRYEKASSLTGSVVGPRPR